MSEETSQTTVDKKKKKGIIIAFAIGIPLIAALVLIVWSICYSMPKNIDINESEYFQTDVVEDLVLTCIEKIDTKDYDALQAMGNEAMADVLTEQTIEAAKSNVSADWGERVGCGVINSTELIQGDIHYAVSEITVSYENVNVIYRLTFDKDMKLAGIYLR